MKPSSSPTFVPLYYQLAMLLEQKMDSGEYPVGSRLPTEAELTAAFGVSVITARHAMKILTDRGRVERFAGKGTFVLERGPVLATWGLGTITDIVMTTATSEMKTLSFGLVESPDWVRNGFRLATATPLHWMRNVRLLKGERFMVSDVYHHPELTRLVRSQKFRKLVQQKKLVINAVCEIAGVSLGEIKQSLSATLASRDDASALLIGEGSPLLLVERSFMSSDGDVLQVGRTQYRVDHHQYDLNARLIDQRSHAERSPRRQLAGAAKDDSRRR